MSALQMPHLKTCWASYNIDEKPNFIHVAQVAKEKFIGVEFNSSQLYVTMYIIVEMTNRFINKII